MDIETRDFWQSMKLAAIYNVFDGDELLPYSITSVYPHVDVIIVVYQNVSNYGEQYTPNIPVTDKTILHTFTPENFGGSHNEITKRNIGLKIAKDIGCTHFLFMDCDEIYQDFGKAKLEYINSGKDGSACEMYTYFKKPTLRLKHVDNYFVPFIHKLNSDTEAGYKHYPLYVDPTRKVKCEQVTIISEKMHHFSWVRKNIERKVNNSSAKVNIQKSDLLKDYNSEVGPGYYLKDYGQELIEVENLFDITF